MLKKQTVIQYLLPALVFHSAKVRIFRDFSLLLSK